MPDSPVPLSGWLLVPRWVRILAAGAAFAALACVVAARVPPRLSLDRLAAFRGPADLAPVNSLGNGEDDVVEVGSNFIHSGRFTAGRFATVWQQNPPAVRLAGTGPFDVRSGLDGISLRLRDSSQTVAWVLDGMGDTLLVLGPFRGPPSHGRPWVGAMIAEFAFDGGGPDARGVVCRVQSNWGPPRAVFLVDPATGRTLWSFPLGSYPFHVLPADLRGHGPTEILVATYSTGNGVSANGTDDSHAYAIALDGRGRRLWQVLLGGVFVEAQALPLPRNADVPSRVVVTARVGRGENPEPSRLAILDGATGRMLREAGVADGVSAIVLVDAARGRFVTGSPGGVLRLWDTDLRRRAARRCGGWVEPWACEDLDGDGRPEIVASTADRALVLDDHLRPRAAFPLGGHDERPGPLRLAHAGVGRWRLLVSGDEPRVLGVRPVPPLQDPRRLGGVAVAGLLGGAIGALTGRPRRRGRYPTAEMRDFLVGYARIRHDVFDRVQVFGALSAWAQREVDGEAVPAGIFERARSEFDSLGRPALERFAARARALDVEPARVQRITALARQLSAALGEVAALPAAERSATARRIADRVRALGEDCAAAYREVGERLGCRADQAAQSALLAKQGGLGERGIAASFSCDPGGAAPVLCDPEELAAVLGQLIENASAALRDAPEPALSVAVRRDPADPRWVVVRVADNGRGIPAAERDDVFRPDVSSRPGGGFGLAHGREVLRAWGGDLLVEEPPGARGAVLCARLRALFPFGAAAGAAESAT